jgi:hypothetical protein
LCKRSKLAGCHFQAIWENEQGDRKKDPCATI